MNEKNNVETIDEEQEILSDDQENIEKPSKTIDDYLALDTTKFEDDNLVDFETTDIE